MSDKTDNLSSFKVGIHTALENIFGYDDLYRDMAPGIIIENWKRLIDGSTYKNKHNYDRHQFEWHDAKRIYYYETPIAQTQLRPHKQILILNVFPKEKMYRNILIKTVQDHFPKVKVLYE